MKILRISVRNIASLFGEHTVDFTKPPLLGTALYSISGPTGSGKSTLLDALCLALYSETPRLNAVEGAVAVDEKGKSVAQNDPRNLLRRGCADGFAEVAFVGVDGAIYTAQWKVWRARNKADGPLQPVQMTLLQGNVQTNGGGVVVSGAKISEVKAAIVGKIGLTFDQFRRAILLAQGDFATFLKANDHERAEILQALTGTVRFARISQAVFERNRAEKRALEELESRLQGSKPMSQEERAFAEAELAVASSACQKMDEELKRLQKDAQWFVDYHRLQKELQEAEARSEEAQRASSAAETRRLELQDTEVVLHEAGGLRAEELRVHGEFAKATAECERTKTVFEVLTEEVRKADESQRTSEAAYQATLKKRADSSAVIQKARALDAKLGPLGIQLVNANSALDEALNAKDAADKECLQVQQSIKDATETMLGLEKEREKVEQVGAFAGDLAAWMDRFGRESEKRKEVQDAQKAIGKAEASVLETSRNVQLGRSGEAQIRSAAEGAALDFDQAQIEEGKWDASQIATDRRGNEAAQKSLAEVQVKAKELADLEHQLEALESEWSGLSAESASQTQRRQILEASEIPRAVLEVEAARSAWSLAEAAVSDAAIALREGLVEGEPCPVCGGHEHPFAEREHAFEVASLRSLKKNFQGKVERLAQLRAELEGLTQSFKGLSAQISAKQKQKVECEQKRVAVLQFTPNESEAKGIWAMSPEQRHLHLERRLKELETQKLEIEHREKNQIAAHTALTRARALKEAALETLRKWTDEVADAERKLENANRVKTEAGAVLQSAETQWNEAWRIVLPVVSGVSFAGLGYEQDPEIYKSRFHAAVKTFLELREEVRCTQERIGRANDSLRPLGIAVNQAESLLKTRAKAHGDAKAEFEIVQQQRLELLGGRSAEDVESELEHAVAATEKERSGALEIRAKAEIESAKAKQIVLAAEEAAVKASLRLSQCGESLETWLLNFARQSGRAIDRVMLDGWLTRGPAWLNQERLYLKGLDDAVSSAKGAVWVRKVTLESHEQARKTVDDWESVSGALEACKRNLEGAVAEVEVKRAVVVNDDLRRNSAGEILNALEEKSRKAAPWGRLNELIGSADGAAFRNIAQQWTLDVLLRYANAQLEQLATRYRLERLKGSLNLIVVDRHMSDQVRSVHSLSGGESFLVSLGLALGLAALTSNRLRIESLFIDEGFGSLDGETLRCAMNALGQLEAQGRKVGVISHVSEMTDAIPVQIRVEKGPGGASRVVVPGGAGVA